MNIAAVLGGYFDVGISVLLGIFFQFFFRNFSFGDIGLVAY